MSRANLREPFDGLHGLGSYLPASQDASKKAEYARELRAQMDQNRNDRDQRRREDQQFFGPTVQGRQRSDQASDLPITLGDGVREMLGDQRAYQRGSELRARNAGAQDSSAISREPEDASERKRQYGVELRAQATISGPSSFPQDHIT